ncbi:MAG: hypothetical protein Q9166_002410 [cf. Caloplaca sp. 2 TL-2023]
MPGSHSTKKLFKNSNDLKELAEHLRPRGSYDPLPPPGGYPLPAYIRRKFSFAPQLPNVSKISLMPDFASSSLGLGLEIEDSEVRNITNKTPDALGVRYSRESLPRRNAVERKQATPKPSLPRINTNLAIGNKARRHDSDFTINTRSYEHRNPRHSDSQRSRSIQRPRGEESLRTQTASTIYRNSQSDSGSTFFYTHSSAPVTPGTVLSSADEEVYRAQSPLEDHTSAYESHLSNADKVASSLLRGLAESTPNFFGSFCIVDLQLPGCPIRVTSHDMLPVHVAPDEVLFLDHSDMGTPYQIRKISNGRKELQILPIVAELVDVQGSSARPSHLVVGQIDLTDFLRSSPEVDEDVWLSIAYEEMDKAGIRQTYPRPGSSTARISSPPSEAEQAIELIRSLHRDYFIIGISGTHEREFNITMVSPTLYACKALRRPEFLNVPKLRSRLKIPQRFITGVKWQTAGLRDKVYCIPMSGPHLVCWLCFLVDSGLPDIWL